MRKYFGEDGAQIHARVSGAGEPLILLPPAPHTGAYFEMVLPHLTEFKTVAVDYPGYGGSDRIKEPSIKTYAAALAPHIAENAVLVGFHTGNLIAAEMSRLMSVRGIVMIDVPFFDAATRQSYAVQLPEEGIPSEVESGFARAVTDRKPGVSDNRAYNLWVEGLRSGAFRSDTFRAAFDYDPAAGLTGLSCPVQLIATQSSLLEPTRLAASTLVAALTERIDITAPVFETYAQEMAATIKQAIQGF